MIKSTALGISQSWVCHSALPATWLIYLILGSALNPSEWFSFYQEYSTPALWSSCEDYLSRGLNSARWLLPKALRTRQLAGHP